MSRRKVWTFSPHSGGSPIPPSVQDDTRRRVLAHAQKHFAGRFLRIDVRFRGALCYIDAYCEPAPPSKSLLSVFGETRTEFLERMRAAPMHLCRLRYFAGHGTWSVAFYTYSHERYEPTFFASGDTFGTPEEAFDVGAVYLD